MYLGKKPSNLIKDWKRKLDGLIDENLLTQKRLQGKKPLIIVKELKNSNVRCQ